MQLFFKNKASATQRSCTHKQGNKGFTLIQISILITIASLLLVTVLPSTQGKLNSDKDSDKKMNAILLALRNYEASNGTLPCPGDPTLPIGSTNYGVPAANSGAGTGKECTGGTPKASYSDSTNHVAIGMVPVRALGLPNSYALDGYGRDITYGVDTKATSCSWANNPQAGQIVLSDNGTLNNTVAALVSHGQDGHGAWIPLTGTTGTAVQLNAGSTDQDQLVNAHLQAGGTFPNPTPSSLVTDIAGASVTFIKKPPTATFDDIVVYKNPLWSLNTLPANSPTITAITPPANGNYTTGQVLTFTATFSGPVTNVTGNPTIDLTIGSNARQASYVPNTASSSILTFTYTVVAGDVARGISFANAYIDTNGGSIQIGTFCPLLSFTPPSLAQIDANAACPTGYVWSRPITIDHTKVSTISYGTLQNYPFLFSSTYSDLATQSNGGTVSNPNGYDLIFTRGATNILPFEQDTYPGTGLAIYWIQIPSLSPTTDTLIYACYDNSAISSPQGGTKGAVWDSSFLGVWHMGGANALNDSTAYNNNAYISNGAPVSTTGVISAGESVNTSDGIASVNSMDFPNYVGNTTFSQWVYWQDTMTSGGVVIGYVGASCCNGYGFAISDGGGGPGNHLGILLGGRTWDASGSNYVLPSNAWTYITVTRTNWGRWNIYANGAVVYQSGDYYWGPWDFTGTINPDQGGLYNTNFHGYIDETRWSNTMRSDDWIMTDYMNQSAPDKKDFGSSGFYTVGTAVHP
jgi:type II secretory pathway pseudopilin PulG